MSLSKAANFADAATRTPDDRALLNRAPPDTPHRSCLRQNSSDCGIRLPTALSRTAHPVLLVRLAQYLQNHVGRR